MPQDTQSCELKMKMDKKFLSKVVTSGSSVQAINQYKFGKKFFHLGPTRDNSIFEKVQSKQL